MNLKQVRKYIAQECLDHVRYRNGNLLYNTFPSSGKSATVLKTIYEAEDGFIWMYFSPTHRVIEGNIELSTVTNFHDVIHLQSRKNLCLSKEYRKLAKENINITPFCENFCSLRDTKCPYYQNLRTIREMPVCIAGVHAHIPTLMQSLLYEKWERRCLFNYYNVIVIDEFPLSSIYNQLPISKIDIDYARDILEMTDINTNESHVLRVILDQLSLATGNIEIKYNKIIRVLSMKALNFDNFLERYDSELLNLITKKRIRKPPKEIFHFLIQIYKKRPTPPELRWMIYKTADSQWHRGMIHLTTSNLDSFRSLPIKVIALDGTADLPTWKSVLGDDCTSITFDIEYKNTYQMIGARNPTSTIIQNNQLTSSGLKLARLLVSICKSKDKKVIVCCSKRIQQPLKIFLRQNRVTNYIFATFFNLRSRNEYYEKADTCVIFHEPNIPPFQAQIIKNILEWDEAIIIKVHREDEMKQGIGRTRQNIPITPRGRKRGMREIFIFPSNNFKRLVPEARFMLYDDMLSYARGGKRRLFFDNLNKVLQSKTFTKTELQNALSLSRNRINHILDVMEKDEIVRVEWGKIVCLKPIKEEEEFLIRIGRSL